MYKKIIPLVSIAGLFFLMSTARLYAVERVEEDVYATVVVNPIFTLSLDNAHIGFGFLKPGESVELAADTYYNSVTCRSNKGVQWYLKISITGEVSGPQPPIQPGNFKWKVFKAEGDGIAAEGWQGFSTVPVVAYTSGERDATGEDVVIQLKYRLDLPQSAIAGIYGVNVMYTMTDVP